MTKDLLRRAALDARAAMPPAVRARDDLARTAALLPRLASFPIVAAYVSTGTEPATGALLGALADRGVLVLLPRLRADGALDLVVDDGSRAPGLRGTVEPSGPAVGVAPAVWVVPALAVDRAGVRLGRGGGSYDRSLPPGAAVIALLHDGELVDALPDEPHDVRVGAVALPGGVVDLPG